MSAGWLHPLSCKCPPLEYDECPPVHQLCPYLMQIHLSGLQFLNPQDPEELITINFTVEAHHSWPQPGSPVGIDTWFTGNLSADEMGGYSAGNVRLACRFPSPWWLPPNEPVWKCEVRYNSGPNLSLWWRLRPSAESCPPALVPWGNPPESEWGWAVVDPGDLHIEYP